MTESKKHLNRLDGFLNKAIKMVHESNDRNKLAEVLNEVYDAYEDYNTSATYEETLLKENKFSTLNSIIESALPKLFTKKSDVVKKCINLIKEDKNLSAQFKFCNALKNYSSDGDAVAYVKEALELTSSSIDRNTLNKSNRKLANFIIENRIKPEYQITEEEMKFDKSCDYLLNHKMSLNNISEMTDNIKIVSDYITEHKKAKNESNNVFKMVEIVEKKMNSLNEDEKSLVSVIMDANTPVAEVKKMNLFNNIKKECITKINKLIDENDGTDKERLLSMKETIMMKEFDANNLVSDVAKLLEVGAILSDSEHDKYM